MSDGLRGDLEFGTIPRMLAIAAERHAGRDAIADGDVTLSYVALAEKARAAAKGLIALGVAHGDRVAIWAPNIWEWVVAALAVHSVGGVLVPINTRYKGGEAAYVLAKSGARALFTVNGFLDTDYVAMLRAAEVSLPELRATIVIRGDAASGALSWADFMRAGADVSNDEASRRARAVAPEDLSDLLFTSGTTGHPKGVMSTHGQSLRAFREWAGIVGLHEGDRYLVVPPFFHSFGYKAGWLACLMTGATIVPQLVFDVDAVLARIGRDKISVIPGPPTLYQSILAKRDPTKHDLSSLRLAVTGAAVIPVDLIHRMRRELSFETIITAYGLTEGTGVSTMCRPDDDPETIATTSGRAIPGIEVQVKDDAGHEMPRGEPGEVVVRGYTVMAGYFGDPAESARAIDADGWLHTGDIGVMDERGNLRITDRKKDMFIVGGFNAYPAEIEAELLRHPAIAQVAVVGIPDERLGEVGMAFVVLLPGASLTGEELVAWSRDRIANYKTPRRVAFVDKLPLNASGKVVKYQLRELAARG
jgi:acyl-CoA synthetase (AMP-forming)/AMP-acid ligase II